LYPFISNNFVIIVTLSISDQGLYQEWCLNRNTISVIRYNLKLRIHLECFGGYGENCSTPCGPNTYGYRCREMCHCTGNQVCDRYMGCINRGEFEYIVFNKILKHENISHSYTIFHRGDVNGWLCTPKSVRTSTCVDTDRRAILN
jgi:hypothetical protein